MSCPSPAVAVYCGSTLGNRPDYKKAAFSLGRALAHENRPLIYGGGSQGLMGVVSQTVLENGGSVTGIIPYAIQAAGGEGDQSSRLAPLNNVRHHEKAQTIVVNSMHERKVEMARRVSGFIGLPGGYGTFEEILEVITWNQLGIHRKPVVLLNVLGFFQPLQDLIDRSIADGYIRPENRDLVVFIDGPSRLEQHGDFDWGQAGLDAMKAWPGQVTKARFDWTKKLDNLAGPGAEGVLSMT